MTFQSHTRIFDVACTPLDACDMRVHAPDAGTAKVIAAKSWLDTDMIAFLEEDDFWIVEELFPRKPIHY
jgi:hypothetical protein